MKKKLILIIAIIILICISTICFIFIKKDKTTKTASKNETIQNSSQEENLENEVEATTSDDIEINQKIKYIGLGDSITVGTKLTDKSNSYYSLLAKNLKSDSENLAVDGMTSDWLLKRLEKGYYDENIKDADLITVSIGSNDLLWVFYEILADEFNIKINSPDDLFLSVKTLFGQMSLQDKTKTILNLYNTFISENTKKDLDEAITSYSENWPKIINRIRKVNSDVKIIALEFYNPYYNITLPLIGKTDDYNFSNYVDLYISQLNQILHDDTNLDYQIADIYSDFNNFNCTNVNLSIDNFNLDPHPNILGHSIIYNKIIEKIKGTF